MIAFLLAAIPTYFTPGPNNLMLMTSAAKFGLQRTIPHGAGISIGFPLMVFVIGLGLGEVFTAVPALKTILKYVAAAYLLWMAWTLLGFKIGSVGGRQRPMRFYEGMLFQWVNPKAWAMATSFVALVIVPGEGRLASLLWLFLGCLLIAPFSTALWMIFGQQLEAVLRKTGTERYLGWILAILILSAVILFLL